jgi:hypothetical protein
MALAIIMLIGLGFVSLLLSAVKDIFGRPQQPQQPIHVVIHNHITNVTNESPKMTTTTQDQEPVSLKRW